MEKEAFNFVVVRNGVKGKAVFNGSMYGITFSTGFNALFKEQVVKANLATGVWKRGK